MARPTQFDRDQVLKTCMEVFWRQGYGATSIRDLLDASGLQPGSLYGAFGSKHALFLGALDYYYAEQLASLRSILGDKSLPPFERIHMFFEELVSAAALDRERKGCLLVNTLLELPLDDESHRLATRMLRSVEKSLCTLLQEAARDGLLGPGKEPALLAKILMNGVFGLRVSGRTYRGNRQARRVVDGLLSLLRG